MSAAAVARAVGGCLAAGLLVGIVVAGLGSRVVMRLLALADPDARGIITENGNVVGEITLGGTVGLILFAGVPAGVLAGLIVFGARRWLPAPLLWRGLVLAVVLLALLGGMVIDPDNFDFFFIDPAGLAVALFGALYLVAGFALAPLADRWGPGVPRFLYRLDATVAGGAILAGAVAFGLVQVGRDIAELV
ncbi:MAG TPA: hypothetical protein VD769_05105 [Gaiellaceae bacterium]|nr:hypothetical protein [Gaiellaceae bacterium]